jgi:hypothetical protein
MNMNTLAFLSVTKRTMRGSLAGSFAFAIALEISCAKGVPSPRYTSHASSEWIEVPFPPPPTRVEVLPEMPDHGDGAVWIDGEWNFEGTRWRWQRGSMIVPEPGARYAPWQLVRAKDGRLYFCKGLWRQDAAL